MTNEIRDETDIDTFVQRFETGATAGGPIFFRVSTTTTATRSASLRCMARI
jgi:hypothetical protein